MVNSGTVRLLAYGRIAVEPDAQECPIHSRRGSFDLRVRVESEHVLSDDRYLEQRDDSPSRRLFEPGAVARGVKGERQFAARLR